MVIDKDKEKELIDQAKDLLNTRRQAYQQTFNPEGNIYSKAVLEDLSRFCRANESTFHPDPRLHAVIEGRREVWLRIMNHVELSQDKFDDIYLARKPRRSTDE